MAEAAVLSELPVDNEADMLLAARVLADKTTSAVLVKGGHLPDAAADLLLANDKELWLRSPRVNTQNTHGTGCTLSSAIACGLARAQTIVTATHAAKSYVTRAMSTGLNLGKGSGPLNHLV
jgi:hydroxymethylpyrimidine/phosphomethylpyrimidine kinase